MEKKDGYGQTKVVSERLLHGAYMKYGLDVRVYRPSSISGLWVLLFHCYSVYQNMLCAGSCNGFSNPLDFGNLLLHACVKLQSAVMSTSVMMRWIPVDFVAEAVVRLSRNPTLRSRVFHLTHEGPRLQDVLSVLAGVHKLSSVSADEWKRKVDTQITGKFHFTTVVCKQLPSPH